jgi:Fic family protein
VYIWERQDWPHFRWDYRRLADRLTRVRHDQGRLLGRMEALGFGLRGEAELKSLAQEVLTTSEIEGEILDLSQVRSSLARRLGLDIGGLPSSDRRVEGIVEMTLDATRHFNQPLTRERLFGWQAELFAADPRGPNRLRVGAWRDDRGGPMQIVSGAIGRERVHFEAPPADRVDAEMTSFLNWFNTPDETDLVLRAGIAHLWLVTIHPFEDGNGRIARAVTDLVLARSERNAQRFYSMSLQIRQERKNYYDQLERTQRGATDITIWLEWFLDCLARALQSAGETLASVLLKARLRERFSGDALNDRQRRILERVVDGLEGRLTTSKWARLAGCSQDTAYRDILELVERGVLRRNPGGGRSTSYSLGDL